MARTSAQGFTRGLGAISDRQPPGETLSRLRCVANAIGARLDETDSAPIARLASEWRLTG